MAAQTNKDKVLQYIIEKTPVNEIKYFVANDVAESLGLQRSNVSALLNTLHKENRLHKDKGKPVKFSLVELGKRRLSLSNFESLIGYDGSFQKPIQLAKAAVLYPGMSLPILVIGAVGSGKKKFTSRVKEFAIGNGLNLDYINSIDIDCFSFDNHNDLNVVLQKLVSSDVTNIFIEINNIEGLDANSRKILLDLISEKGKTCFIICTLNDNVSMSIQEYLKQSFSVVIELTPLNKRPLLEKLSLVETFIQRESQAMNRIIKVNAQLLTMLLVYDPVGDVAQLKKDIKISCANAYVREFDNESDDLFLRFNDFPTQVRNGVLRYTDNKSQIDAIIQKSKQYSYNGNIRDTSKLNKLKYNTVYDLIEEKRNELLDLGVSTEEVSKTLSYDIKTYYQIIEDSTSVYGEVSGSIKNMVSEDIITFVRDFLKESALKLERKFEKNTFYSLCLHLSRAINRAQNNEKIDYKLFSLNLIIGEQERQITIEFIRKVNSFYNINLPEEEIPIIAMFISLRNDKKTQQDSPVVLIAMHGDNIASSMASVVNSFTQLENIYAFDLPLDGDISDYYHKLKSLIININRSQGILMIYDMGSLKTMAESISIDTQIPIKTLEVPATLIAIDASRKANMNENINDLYESVVSSYDLNYQSVRKDYAKAQNSKVIITLCVSGEGGAVQVKDYLDENLKDKDIMTVPLSLADKILLQNEIDEIRENHQILYVIGAYDPKIMGIPYISLTELFDGESLRVKNLLEKSDIVNNNSTYKKVFDFIESQYENFDVQSLREEMPDIMRKLGKLVPDFTTEQELGLLMHISSNIYLLQINGNKKSNLGSNTTILNNKRLYNEIKDILMTLECTFLINFSDEDIANIILILKKN